MPYKSQNKKQTASSAEKESEEHQQEGAKASSPMASHDDDEMNRGDEAANLTLILRELREFRQDNKHQLEDIKEEIAKTNSRMDEAEARIVESEERLQSAEDVLAEMVKIQEQLQAKLTDQEGRSRKENRRIYGIPEGAEGGPGSMIPFVEKLLRENLSIAALRDMQIERAHRALAPQPPAGAQPRSILVRFLSFRMKEEIIKLAWQKKGFTWGNSKINLDHDYAPGIMARRREYAEARRLLKDKNIKFQTLYPARMRVFYEDGTTTYETVEEATEDLARRGFPVKVISQPKSLMERIQRWSWQPARSRDAARSGKAPANYKEKLQVFRRTKTQDTG